MINDILDKDFWKALLIRVIKTWCQAFVGVVGVDGAGRTLAEVDWWFAISAATVAAIICLVWNIGAGLPEVKYVQNLEQLEEIRPALKTEDLDDYDEEDDE